VPVQVGRCQSRVDHGLDLRAQLQFHLVKPTLAEQLGPLVRCEELAVLIEDDILSLAVSGPQR
jgi:hypothetical protein